MSDEKKVTCPKCGAELPDDTIEQLLKKEQKEMSYLLIGVVLGAVLGLVGSLWVGFLFEALRNLISARAGGIIPTMIKLRLTNSETFRICNSKADGPDDMSFLPM